VDGSTSNPFGEKPESSWRRARRWTNTKRNPKRYARTAGALGPIAGLFLTSDDGLDKPTRLLILAGFTVIPPLAVEGWWRVRERRRAETLMSIPEQTISQEAFARET
jgi:hypothetical protein